MSTAAPPRPQASTPPPAPQAQLTPHSVLTPTLAGLATVCAASALTGVIQGLAWFGYVIVATVLVACTGLALRAVRAPALVVSAAQMLVLTFLVIGAFTRSGFLAILPGPAALTELNGVLVAAFEQIRTGLAPVEATTPILCLVTIAIGLVAITVDTLAVAAAAPAATGLLLLCVYAVPSALAEDLLPWWTFALGAASFAALLAADGSHRHRTWRNRSAPGLGASPGSASGPVGVVAAALVVGLVAGSTVTAIGTEGSLPGSSGNGQNVPGGLGVNPFTSLRGMLDQGSNVELFRVRGLENDRRLLRAFTLDTYRPNQGWGLPEGPMPAGVPASGPLPMAPGDDGTGDTREIRIEPVNWFDLWLPMYGAPRSLRNVAEGWYYDRTSGIVFRERRIRPAAYVESASLREPSKAQLRETDPRPAQVPPIYTTAERVDPRVSALARQLTASATNDFDRAEAIWRYFSPANGFVYDLQTAPANDSDALADFLLNGKRGFCEQYASSMAVMLRAVGIPSRVAVGFTSGVPTGDYRSITSQDAHAWVEVYFGDQGWVSFDPTPLSDGRGYIPSYLRPDEVPNDPVPSAESAVPSASASEQPSQTQQPDLQAGSGSEQDSRPFYVAPSWSGWGALVAGLLATVLTAAIMLLGRRITGGRHSAAAAPMPRWLPPVAGALWGASLLLLAWQLHWAAAVGLLVVAAAVVTPSVVRDAVRRRRLDAIAAGKAGAADAAWNELLDECADRGIEIARTDTVRLAAQKVAQRHHLDDRGKNDLRAVVSVVERSWYSRHDAADPELGRAFQGLRESLQRNAPMSWRGRLLPRSLFRRRND
ncbi:DUF3488 and transglutaminase-like domain-containing protein [Saccharomonospora sp. NPDC046836]|uniref:transglutaminase family protein n=1 Tax=Saccharomonospora sp. NPDC046836 TaxID=3156921 RepID=UPI0033BFEC91